jgi:hypothetical protein
MTFWYSFNPLRMNVKKERIEQMGHLLVVVISSPWPGSRKLMAVFFLCVCFVCTCKILAGRVNIY